MRRRRYNQHSEHRRQRPKSRENVDLIDATKDLVEEVGRFTREEGILIANPLDPESPEPNLLVVFDGLDELASQGKAAAETARAFVREVERMVEKRNIQGPRVRVLISGRELVVQENESEFRRPRQVLTLLPYYMPSAERRPGHSEDLVAEWEDSGALLKTDLRQTWWKKMGALSGAGYKGLPRELQREDLAEVTAQPLLNYLVALSFARGKIDFKKEINLNVIYSDLVTAVYERGYERRRTYESIRHMTADQFLRVLEEVGLAAWHGDGRSTTVKEIEEHCRLSGVGTLLEAFQDGARAGVTRLLAAFFFRKHGQRSSGDPTFVFTHKSFGEFLAARRVVRAADRIVREMEKRRASPDDGWDERDALRHWAIVCGATAISRYLHGFIFSETKLRPGEELIQWQECFVRLFSYQLRHGLPIEQLNLSTFRDGMFRTRNAEEALLVVLNACASHTRRVSDIKHPDPTAFGAWFKRIQGQRSGAESSLAARCLAYLNLEGVILDIVDLYGANLEHSNLKGVAAHFACLEHANLSGANLSHARLWRANLQSAILERADLTGTQLEEADLRFAMFAHARLDRVRVWRARIEEVRPKEIREVLRLRGEEERRELRERIVRERNPKVIGKRHLDETPEPRSS